MILSDSPKIQAFNVDCMEFMKDKPDNYYDLAIVDPPYGIGNWCPQNLAPGSVKITKKVEWNDSPPPEDYFNEVRRVSNRWMFWGANYYNSFDSLGGALVWYKGGVQDLFSQCEIASISWQKKIDYVKINWQAGFYRVQQEGEQIHQCQKPVKLYRWILDRYAKEGDKILDTHGGSFSAAIACHLEGFDLDICELDEDYFNDAVKRFKLNTIQEKLF